MSDNENILENIVDSIDNLSMQQDILAQDTLSRDISVQKGLAETDQRLQEQINEINSGWDIDLSKNYPLDFLWKSVPLSHKLLYFYIYQKDIEDF